MRTFLRGLLRGLRTDVWTRAEMIRRDGVWKWLAYEWRFVRFLWEGRNDEIIRPSDSTLAERFLELRLGFDVTGTVSRWDLIEFARLSGCEDLMREARMSAEEYQLSIENQGGMYPLAGLRESFNGR